MRTWPLLGADEEHEGRSRDQVPILGTRSLPTPASHYASLSRPKLQLAVERAEGAVVVTDLGYG